MFRVFIAVLFMGLLGCSGSKPESASFGKAINDAAKENERLMGEIDQLKNQIADFKRSQAVLVEENEQLRSKLDASTRRIEEAERKSKMAVERNVELVKQTEILANENKKLAKENQDLRDTIKGLVAPVEKKKTSGARSP
jgi:chromosome segregation ATPase